MRELQLYFMGHVHGLILHTKEQEDFLVSLADGALKMVVGGKASLLELSSPDGTFCRFNVNPNTFMGFGVIERGKSDSEIKYEEYLDVQMDALRRQNELMIAQQKMQEKAIDAMEHQDPDHDAPWRRKPDDE